MTSAIRQMRFGVKAASVVFYTQPDRLWIELNVHTNVLRIGILDGVGESLLAHTKQVILECGAEPAGNSADADLDGSMRGQIFCCAGESGNQVAGLQCLAA